MIENFYYKNLDIKNKFTSYTFMKTRLLNINDE